MAPFLGRPRYVPLQRPHDPKRATVLPDPPDSLPGVVYFPPLARAAARLGRTLSEVDEMSIEDVLDEADLAAYLHDVDVPPDAPR